MSEERRIVIDNVYCGEWPLDMGVDQAEEVAPYVLSQVFETYRDKAPFFRFDEGMIELLTRMAKAMTQYFVSLDADKIVTEYLRQFGMPTLTRL